MRIAAPNIRTTVVVALFGAAATLCGSTRVLRAPGVEGR
jgi:hypothetical protein